MHHWCSVVAVVVVVVVNNKRVVSFVDCGQLCAAVAPWHSSIQAGELV